MNHPRTLTTAQVDRAAGVLLATAAGDALGVPYEFSRPPAVGEPAAMTGGGLGGFAPGEWSDDTAMAVAVARVAATGADLATPAALDEIATGFLAWYDAGPADIGIQTSAVLAATRRRLDAGSGAPVG
ncbi:ADP-ribosylglycohydrolase family protein [Nocardioides sambongensis]|uniref:ADP-ribosylglycohydrolase family protein n=1 Tax=Nocardioides sambongensis TaxID=2589074 RepID=UPI001E577665|nr:ADP-ribosylglycohydrolase family protein [Nocardioides sambongensis]